MAASSGDYTGCSILIHDEGGNHLCSTVVTSFDKSTLRIEVEETPKNLINGAFCRLLILSSPAPYEYHGRVIKEGTRIAIAMYKGQEKENRGAARYEVNLTARIEHLICDGRAYPLHTPLEVRVLNISKSGVRFRTPFYALSDGDRFNMRMKISDNEKLLIASVTNHSDHESKTSEYGCSFLISKDKGG